MVGVAINENVIITKVAKADDKQSLMITFATVEEKVKNLFELSQQSGQHDVVGTDATVRIWGLKVPTFKNADKSERSDAEKRDSISIDLQERKNALHHILSRYLVSDDIKFDQYEGIDIGPEDWESKWLDNTVLTEMFSVLCDQFITMITPFIGDPNYKSRLKLLRQSADKPFPTFPGARYISNNPFYEPMDVPAADTKIKFSKYEIEKGLTSTEVPSKDDADETPEATPEATTNLFGRR